MLRTADWIIRRRLRLTARVTWSGVPENPAWGCIRLGAPQCGYAISSRSPPRGGPEMDTAIWIVVAVVVVLILLAVALMLMRRQQEARRSKAHHIRETATEKASELRKREAVAAEADARARQVQAEADAKAAEAPSSGRRCPLTSGSGLRDPGGSGAQARRGRPPRPRRAAPRQDSGRRERIARQRIARQHSPWPARAAGRDLRSPEHEETRRGRPLAARAGSSHARDLVCGVSGRA